MDASERSWVTWLSQLGFTIKSMCFWDTHTCAEVGDQKPTGLPSPGYCFLLKISATAINYKLKGYSQ